MFNVVYVVNDLIIREVLWRKFILLGGFIQIFWLFSGDFSNILLSDDRLNGNDVIFMEIRGLQECLNFLNFIIFGVKGWYYMWSNKQDSF